MTFRDFQQEFKSLELEVEDEDEADRLEHIAACVTAPCPSLHTHQPNKSQPESPWERNTQEEEGERSVLASFVSPWSRSEANSHVQTPARRRNKSPGRRTMHAIRVVPLLYRGGPQYTRHDMPSKCQPEVSGCRATLALTHGARGKDHGVGLWSLESNLGWKHQHPGLLEHGCREWNLAFNLEQSGATSGSLGLGGIPRGKPHPSSTWLDLGFRPAPPCSA